MADDIERARARLYDKVRSTGACHSEAKHRAEKAIRTADGSRDSGANPGPGSKVERDENGRVRRGQKFR